MSLNDITEKIKQKMTYAADINAKVKFDFGDDGIIFIDATQNPPTISHDDSDADTTLSCSVDTFKGFLEGTQDPNVAFMMGKLKVKGAMGVALKLNAMLES